MKELFMDIGNPIVLYGAAIATDVAKAASDCAAGVPIKGMCSVLFTLIHAGVAEQEAPTFQIQYSSTGLASDAVTSNAGMTCTDAVFTYSTASSNAAVQLLHFDISAKGLLDGAGKLFATRTASGANLLTGSLAAFPILGTSRLPASLTSDVTTANSVA